MIRAGLLAVAVAFTLAGCSDTCSPEAREHALSSDVRAVLAGQLTEQVAIERETQRVEGCGE